MDIDKIDDLYDDIIELRIIIESTHLTDSDSNVLSVAMQKIEKDKASLENTIEAMCKNQYDDMINYFETKVEMLYHNLKRDYGIVCSLYCIAKDKNRESLLKYLDE